VTRSRDALVAVRPFVELKENATNGYPFVFPCVKDVTKEGLMDTIMMKRR